MQQLQKPNRLIVMRTVFVLSLLLSMRVDGFQTSCTVKYAHTSSFSSRTRLFSSAEEQAPDSTTKDNRSDTKKKPDNKAMSFLKKIGKVGGRQDFTHALGVDEGSAGKAALGANGMGPLRKSKLAYKSCEQTGLIDDCRESFPLTSLGTEWSGFTDQVMGGQSTALLAREADYYGRAANVLRGTVRALPGQPNKFGFVQMAANLVQMGTDERTVDASAFDGVELDVLYEGESPQESFNVHFKTDACQTPMSSYRATFSVETQGTWQTIRLPWSQFQGHGAGAAETPFQPTKLIRAGIVAIGKAYPTLGLGVSGVRFFKQ